MEQKLYQEYLNLLRRELIPALGCTEPIAIAYAAAVARRELGMFPERMELRCSGNIIKNVKGVTVPNSGGMKGLAAAAILGVVGGDADRELEVLEGVTDAHHIHVRSIDGYTHAASLHVVSERSDAIMAVTAVLNEMGIPHVTVQVEREMCPQTACALLEEREHHHEHHHHH